MQQGSLNRPLSLQRLPSDELDVVLVIDTSGSMQGAPLQAAIDAANGFFRELPPGARVAGIAFGDEAELIAPLSDQLGLLAERIERLEADGETALYDAVDLAIEQFPLDRTSRRTVVLLSDGEDTVSEVQIDEVAARLGDADVDLQAIAFDADERALSALDQMALSGDRSFVTIVESPDDLLAVYREMGSTLANQYRILFTPSDLQGQSAEIIIDHLGVSAAAGFEFEAPAPIGTAAASNRARPSLSVDRVPLEPTFAVGAAPWYADDSIRLGSIAGLALALGVVGYFLVNAGPGAVRLAGGRVANADPATSITNTRDRMTHAAEGLLERRDRQNRLGASIERAGLAVRPAEFLVLVSTAALLAGLLGTLVAGLGLGIALILLVGVGALVWLSMRASRRTAAFTEQLGNTVQLLAGSLRAGYALPQAMETVADESEAPTSDEFHRLVTELRLGRDINSSLGAMASRVPSNDFDWVIRAIAIHRDVGGDLAEVLDNINTTIRDRGYIRRQFKALSAEGRYSAYLLVALPFIVFVLLSITNPDYIDGLVTDDRGRLMLLGALVSMSIGAVWLSRIVRVRF